jgi:heptosyltransferase-2
VAYYKPYSAFLYSHTKNLRSGKAGKADTTIDDRLSLLEPLINEPLDRTIQPTIYLAAKEIAEARVFLQEKGVSFSDPVIMLSILGSSPSKTYPLPFMARVIEILAGHTTATFLFNYIPSQESDARELLNLCRPATQKRIAIEAFAGDLRKFLGLLKHCDCIIGNEGGSTNMAKALGIPTFSIFAPWTDKKGWHTFADDRNIAVHLEDLFPEAVSGKSLKQIREQSTQLYQLVTPDTFKDQLLEFLQSVS